MNWEANNPGLVKLLGVGLAATLIVIGATVAPAAMAYLAPMATFALGAVGLNVTGKSQ